MAKKTWPALKPCKDKSFKRKLCKRKRRKAGAALCDRLSCLPNDILLAILSRLNMKDAAKSSLVSHKWNQLWRHYPCLHFEDPGAMSRGRCKDKRLIDQQRSNFVCRVNSIVDRHLGPVVDEFRVVSDLNNEYRCDIDKWVAFSLSNQVKRLEIDFFFYSHNLPPEGSEYELELQSCIPLLPHNLTTVKPVLTSLCLKFVNVNVEVVECFLTSFPFLEELRISSAHYLTNITACVSVPLKHLVVCNCRNLNGINLSAPKLLSFAYSGCPIKLSIKNASVLARVSVGNFDRDGHPALYFDALSNYFPQLTYLQLNCRFNDEFNLGVGHLGMNCFPKLTNLKHLILQVLVRHGSSLLGWTPLIEESPMLQKLTLKLMLSPLSRSRGRREVVEVDLKRRRLECLETLEIVGSVGRTVDLEFAAYVFKNAYVLKEVIIDDCPYYHGTDVGPKQDALKRAEKLKQMLPQGVELMFRWPGQSPVRL